MQFQNILEALKKNLAADLQLTIAPDKLQSLQAEYLQNMQALWTQGLQASTGNSDRRFAHEAWRKNPLSAFQVASYQLQAKTMTALAEQLQGDEKTVARLRFAVQQWLAAAAPSNFLATNPEVQEKAIATQGESLRKGLNNLLADVRKGHMSMTDESQFEVGKNLATTPGQVIFENEFFQLIEYAPQTAQVHAVPLVMVPACINKFYILDLQEKNSLARYAVEQGIRTFMVSWRNPDASIAHATWDNYVQDVIIKAIEVAAEISPTKTVNALGFCIGGTLLANALAVLAARGDQPVASATFLTTLLDFENTGVLSLFVDEAGTQLRELQLAEGGLLDGHELSSTFSFLRPNELVWNYVVGNYLKGETPPPFDLLYWNADSTHVPGPMYTWYLRNTYLENNLCKPNTATVCGVPIDLRRIELPVYYYASYEDHIVPIEGAYQSMHAITGAKRRFVMGASGHIAGVINPPKAGKRSYWSTPASAKASKAALPASHADWMKKAQEQAGSWWSDWSAWLKPQSGKLVAAPKKFGNKNHQPIEPAPGRYVQVRI